MTPNQQIRAQSAAFAAALHAGTPMPHPDQASLWLSIATQWVPDGTPLTRCPRARWLLDEAAVWQAPSGLTGTLWKFPDRSYLCASEGEAVVVAAREWVR